MTSLTLQRLNLENTFFRNLFMKFENGSYTNMADIDRRSRRGWVHACMVDWQPQGPADPTPVPVRGFGRRSKGHHRSSIAVLRSTYVSICVLACMCVCHCNCNRTLIKRHSMIQTHIIFYMFASLNKRIISEANPTHSVLSPTNTMDSGWSKQSKRKDVGPQFRMADGSKYRGKLTCIYTLSRSGIQSPSVGKKQSEALWLPGEYWSDPEVKRPK